MKVCRCESAFSCFFFFKQSLFDHGNSCYCRQEDLLFFDHCVLSQLLIIPYLWYLFTPHRVTAKGTHSKLQTFIKLCSLVNNKINHFYFLKLSFKLIYPVFIFCILKKNRIRYLEFEAKSCKSCKERKGDLTWPNKLSLSGDVCLEGTAIQ